MVLIATVMAKLLLAFDYYHQQPTELSQLLPFLSQIYQGSPESIRSVLTVIASSMMTVTSIAFSITVVALSLASSQFGPRLIRNFMADKGTQSVLGVFVSIFIYCVLVLQATKEHQEQAFVPGLSAYFAVVLAFVGVGVLIYFTHHVAQAIQADNVVNDVYCRLLSNVKQWFPDEESDSKAPSTQQQAESDAVNIALPLAQQYEQVKTVCAVGEGYIQALDTDKLLTLAKHKQVAIDINCMAGDFIAPNSTLFTIYYDKNELQQCVEEMRSCFMLGSKRTPIQDSEFAIHQLVEIAVRALSPGINDPYTAITCVDKLSAFLCTLAQRTLPSAQHFDSDGVLRILTKTIEFASLGEAAFNQIRQYGKDSIAVTVRLLDSLYRIACCCRTAEQIQFVARQTEMIEESTSQIFIATYDLHDITTRIHKIKAKLSQRNLEHVAPNDSNK
jgi:uncharacterized membrane protein